MAEQDTGRTDTFSPDWVLRRLPAISYVVQNDEYQTVRFVESPTLRNFGYDPRDFVDNKRYYASSTVHPEDVDVSDEQIDKSGQGQFVAARNRILDVNGHATPSIAFTRGAMAADGRCLGIVGLVLDVHRLEDLRGESRVLCSFKETDAQPAKLAGARPTPEWVINQLPGVVFVCDSDPLFRVRYLAGAWAGKLLGYDKRDFTDAPKYFPAWVIHPDDADLIDSLFEQLMQRPGESAAVRFRLVRDNGEPVQVLDVLRSLPEEDGGLLCGWVMPLTPIPALQGKSKILGWL